MRWFAPWCGVALMCASGGSAHIFVVTTFAFTRFNFFWVRGSVVVALVMVALARPAPQCLHGTGSSRPPLLFLHRSDACLVPWSGRFALRVVWGSVCWCVCGGVFAFTHGGPMPQWPCLVVVVQQQLSPRVAVYVGGPFPTAAFGPQAVHLQGHPPPSLQRM